MADMSIIHRHKRLTYHAVHVFIITANIPGSLLIIIVWAEMDTCLQFGESFVLSLRS